MASGKPGAVQEAIWTGAARDPGAEAVIIATVAAALLMLEKNQEQDFEALCERAGTLWSHRRVSKD